MSTPPTVQVLGLIPAAGRSRRMGAAKQLLPWGDATILSAVAGAVADGGVDGLVIVTNPTVSASLDGEFRAQHDLVLLDDPQAEMIDSIIAGVLALRTLYHPVDRDAFLVCPADLPRMNAALVRRGTALYRENPNRVVAPAADGRPRHPLIVPFAMADELNALHGVGLQGLFARLPQPVLTYAADDPAALTDVDTPADYNTGRPPNP